MPDEIELGLDEVVADDYRGDGTVPCYNLDGVAGTGKTTLIRQRMSEDPHYAVLSATTGIAAVNLGCITLHSLLGYFNENSLRDLYLSTALTSRLRKLAREERVRYLLIEEKSMLTARSLDMLYRACSDVCQTDTPLGLALVGDFCQLPPIRDKEMSVTAPLWAFEADCWERFAENTEKLTKVWRQDQQAFLDALNMARVGDGAGAAATLASAGVQFHSARQVEEFDGTTIVTRNEMVASHNGLALGFVRGQRFEVTARRWGKQRTEWGQSRRRTDKAGERTGEWGIPPRAEFKVGAYVMILSNDTPEFTYVNGDCGHIVEYDEDDECFRIELVRNGRVVDLYRLVRNFESKEKPDGWRGAGSKRTMEDDPYRAQEHMSPAGRYVSGQVEFFPLRLAYATTIHKSQGLSLDRIQFDFRDSFAKAPGMCYVALSRCRTLEGLRLVGHPDILARHCTTDPKVRGYL